MEDLRKMWAYFALKQPPIKYSNGAIPPEGWRFRSIEEMEQKLRTFTQRCGYNFRYKGTSGNSRAYACAYERSKAEKCPVRWRAEFVETDCEFTLGKRVNRWRIVHLKPDRLHHGHSPVRSIPTIDPVDIAVIWVGVPAGPLVNEDGSSTDVGVPFATPGSDQRLVPKPNLEIAEAAYGVRDALGQEFVLVDGETTWVQESLVTALATTTQNPHLNLVATLKWDRDILKKLRNAIADIQPKTETLVLVGEHTAPPPKGTPPKKKFRDTISILMAANNYLHVFPHPAESEWEECKIGDLTVFQDIANDAAAAGMDLLSFRPRTCDGGLSGQRCKLPYIPNIHNNESKMVIKRNLSCGGHGVEVVHTSNRHNLKCVLQEDEPLQAIDPYNHYFHQEFVRSLRDLGEFRAFVERNTTDEAIDGLIPPGKIVYIVHTVPEADFSTARAKPLTTTDLADIIPDKAQNKFMELELFVSLSYAALLWKSENLPGLQSVRTVCRMDLGLSDEVWKFFFNELTRGYKGSHFAVDDDIRISEAFGRTFWFEMMRMILKCGR